MSTANLRRKYRFTLRQAMLVISLLALDFAWLPLRFTFWVLLSVPTIALFDAFRKDPSGGTQVLRARSNARLLATVAGYALINIIAVPLAVGLFGQIGEWVCSVFATFLPVFFVIVVALFFIYENAFDKLVVFIAIDVLALLAYGSYLFGLMHSSAV
jgi:hypothetical protein